MDQKVEKTREKVSSLKIMCSLVHSLLKAMASTPQFVYESVRQLQKSSTDELKTDPYSSFDAHPSLLQASKSLRAKDAKKALQLIDEFIAKAEKSKASSSDDVAVVSDADAAAASLDAAISSDAVSAAALPEPPGFNDSILHQALLLRADIHAEMRNFLRAKKDLERAILFKV